MNRKKLLVLPVVMVVLTAFFSFTVMAADSDDPTHTGFRVYQNNGLNGSDDDVTSHFDCGIYSNNIDITKDSSLQSKLKEIDKNLKPSDFTNRVSGMDIKPKDGDTGSGPWKVLLTIPVDTDEIGIVAHQKEDGSVVCRVFKGTGNSTCAYIEDVKDFYPFVLYTSKTANTARAGFFASPYVALFSVALISCGVMFAISAKKSPK